MERFDLYAMTSLAPANALTGGLSARIRLGIDRQYDERLHRHVAWLVGGGLGLTLGLTPDIDLYGLASAGLALARNGAYVYGDPEVGLIVNEIWRMKSLLAARVLLNQFNDSDPLYEMSWRQSKAIGSDILLFADYSEIRNGRLSDRRWGLALKRYF